MSSFFTPAPEPPTALGRLRVLSPKAGVKVSPLCLGGMSIGTAWKEGMGSMDKEVSFKLLDAFLAAGGNFIDTACGYQDEESEKWIGEWMKERDVRDRIVLATKYTANYRSHASDKNITAAYSGNSKKALHLSVRDSLKKLNTDYIDILYLHWWDFTTSIKEVMDSLNVLVEQGKVLYLGVSDTPAWIVSAANTYAEANGKTPFSIYQGRWNVMIRDFERDILPMCREFGMALCPWDVLGGGKLQTKKQLEERQKNKEGLRNLLGNAGQTEEEEKYSATLEKIATEHGTESITAVALAYVMSKAPYVFPLIGGRKVEHLHDNISALTVKLTAEDIAAIEGVKPFDLGFPHNFIGIDPAVTGQQTMMGAISTFADFVQGPQSINLK